MQALQVALVISKGDVPFGLNRIELGALVGLPELREAVGHRLRVIELVSTSTMDLQPFRDFLHDCRRRNSHAASFR